MQVFVEIVMSIVSIAPVGLAKVCKVVIIFGILI